MGSWISPTFCPFHAIEQTMMVIDWDSNNLGSETTLEQEQGHTKR